MSKAINQFQNDVNGVASSLMTQMLCAERGMNYAQLQQMAEQAHINGILLQEQQRQQNQVINRHYQGNSFVSKLRDVFGAQPSNFLPVQPMAQQSMMQQPMFPQAPMPMQQGYMQPNQVAAMFQPQPVMQAPQPQYGHPQAPVVSPAEIEMFTQLIQGIVAAVNPQQQQAAPTQQHVPQQQVPDYSADVPTYTAPIDVPVAQ